MIDIGLLCGFIGSLLILAVAAGADIKEANERRKGRNE